MSHAAHDFEALLKHHDFVEGLARQLVGDESRAQDVTQQTWLAAFRRPPRRDGVRSWLGTVVRNFARQQARSESRRSAREQARPAAKEQPTPDEILERESARRLVVEAVQILPEKYRAVVLLRYFEDLLPQEIAKNLELPVETVKTRLQHAHAQLRQRLDDVHDGDSAKWRHALLPLVGLGGGSSLQSSGAGGAGRVALGQGKLSTAVWIFLFGVLIAMPTWLLWRGGSEPDVTNDGQDTVASRELEERAPSLPPPS